MKKLIVGRKNFILTLSVAVFLFVASIALFTFANDKRIVRDNRDYLINDARKTAGSIDNAISEGNDNIKILSALVSESLTGPDFDIASIQDLIQNSVFDFMEFADAGGMDHNITGGVSDARDRQYFLDARAGNSGMELIHISRATHETLLFFYSPMYYKGEFIGSLCGVYQAANRITRLLSSDYSGEAGTAYLATESGRIIASSEGFDPRQVMFVNELAGESAEARSAISNCLSTGEAGVFSLEGNPIGACIVRLPESGYYLVQIFPAQVSNRMIRNANTPGYHLVLFLILLYAAIILSLIRFYRNQQKQLEAARQQAEHANNAKTRFLFSMSHDIRTPMNAILGFTGMGLKNIDDREKVQDCLGKIHQSGNLLLSLINSVLEMSRIESGSAQSEEEPLDIYESFSGIESTLCIAGEAKNVDVSFSFGEISDRYVLADQSRCIRVFTNLINNAVKYTPEGGFVKVMCEQCGPALNGVALYRYTVSDNGMGMSKEFQAHMFEAFTREHTASSSGIQGTGLGLSVCKTFVDFLRGTIECESSPGKGTTFTVTLPFALCEEADEPCTPEVGKTEVTAFEGLRGRRALLVEDNELNRELAGDILGDEGIIVEEAVNGAEAVKALEEKGPDYYDFILMDIQMPVMDGYQATREIRRKYPDSRIPIIALSANAFAEDKAASLEAGMNDHIAKPIDIHTLLTAILKCI